MDAVVFILGFSVGIGSYHLWLQTRPKTFDYDTNGVEVRLQALEEQLAYLAGRLEEVQDIKVTRSTRPRKPALAATPSKQEQVLQFLEQGIDVRDIARETGVPQGQIELVAKLHKRV